MSDIFILHWLVKDECEIHKSVNFFYIKSEKLHCCTISLDISEFYKFKSIKNKNKFLEKRILNKEFILNENIEHLTNINKFVKERGLQKKWREWQLKNLLRKSS